MVYDSGNGNAVGNFLGGLTQALPPFHEVAKMAGIELPEYLGEMTKDEGPVGHQTIADDDHNESSDEAA